MTASNVRLTRGYTHCRYGQMHFLAGEPAAATRLAPPAILLHQNPSSSMEYEPILSELCQDRRVIAFDTPGYGMSDPPPGPMGIAAYAAAFSDALDALLPAEPVDVFGFHTGSLLAIELALLRPDRVARLALSGIPMRDPAERAAKLQAARASPQPTDDGRLLLAQSAALWRYIVTERNPAVPLERAVDIYAEKNRSLHRGWWAYEGVWSYDYARLPLLQQHTLVLQPEDSLLQASQSAARMIPNAQFKLMRGLERDALELGASEFTQALRNFFLIH